MQERLIQIKHYIDNYKKSNNSEVLNYYYIFELMQSSDIYSIMEDIKKKKLKILFHPDLLAYIPEQDKQYFEILSTAVTDMENVFSNFETKLIYDNKLRQSTISRNSQTNQFKSTSDLEKLNSIVTTNINKYGFKFTSEALNMIIKNEDFRGITKTNSSRTKANILGKERIEKVLNDYNNSKNPNLNVNIINYYSRLVCENIEMQEKLNAYVDACSKTALKYGINQVSYAIDNTLRSYYYDNNSKNIYAGFTNNGSAREKLKNLVNPNDIAMLSRIYLNIHRHNQYQNDEIATISDNQIISNFLDALEEKLSLQNSNNHHR